MNKNHVRGITLSDFKTDYIATVVKTMYYWWRLRKSNGTENSGKVPQVRLTDLRQKCKRSSMEEIVFFKLMVLK